MASSIEPEKIIESLTFRLPKEVRPEHYDLFLNAELEKNTVTGNVEISVNVAAPITSIVLHSRNINITSTVVHSTSNNLEIPISESFEYKRLEFWVIRFKDELQPGPYRIKFEFTSSNYYDGDPYYARGFYKVGYPAIGSAQEKVVAAALFEPTEARSIFPCFDEPDMKATFKLKLQYPKWEGYYALSNMAVEETKEVDNYFVTSFQKSVPMSTFTFGMVISDFEHRSIQIEPKGVGEPFEMRIHIQKGLGSSIDFQMEFAKKAIEFIIDYTKVPYSLPKLDMVVIPAQFRTGGLENWGLIVMTEESFIGEASNNSPDLRAAATICHELAHMWFGNLVTAEWWSDLWLSEGFATFMSRKTLETIKSDWKNIDMMYWHRIDIALEIDNHFPESRALVQETNDWEAIENVFGSLTYAKGYKLLEMLENIIGKDTLQKLVSSYLDKYKFGSVRTIDLIQQLESVSPESHLRSMVESWTSQVGFPLVSVEQTGSGQYKLTQKRCMLGVKTELEDKSFSWTIPITYVTNIDSTPKVIWFNSTEKEVVLNLPQAEWIKLNKERIGFYRVNYSKDLWHKLATALKNDINVLTPFDRLSLLEDAFTQARFSHIGFDSVLELLQFLENELDPRVWMQGGLILSFIHNILFGEDLAGYKKFARQVVKKFFDNLDWKSHPEIIEDWYKETILEFACESELEEAVSLAKAKFQAWLDSSEDLAKLPKLVGEVGMLNEEKKDVWEKMWKLYDTNPDEKLYLILLNTKDEAFLKKLLERTKASFGKYEFYTPFRRITYSHPQFVWNYVLENWDDVVKESPDFNLKLLLADSMDATESEARYSELDGLFEKLAKERQEESGLKHYVFNCIKERSNQLRPIKEWLKDKKYV